MCTKKHVPRKKGYWQIVKTGESKAKTKTKPKKQTKTK